MRNFSFEWKSFCMQKWHKLQFYPRRFRFVLEGFFRSNLHFCFVAHIEKWRHGSSKKQDTFNVILFFELTTARNMCNIHLQKKLFFVNIIFLSRIFASFRSNAPFSYGGCMASHVFVHKYFIRALNGCCSTNYDYDYCYDVIGHIYWTAHKKLR